MIAIKRLYSIMWILIVAMGALSTYLVSLRVATERNAVTALERKIYQSRANIRYLEVEFSARSTMRQLAAWNAHDIKYSVPGAGQYLASEQQLASYAVLEPTGPTYAAPPVMAAMTEAEPKAAPAVAAPAPAPAVAVAIPVKAVAAKPRKEDADFARVRDVVEAAAPVRARAIPAVATVSATKASATPRVVKLVDKGDPEMRRATRLAMLEETLLGAKPLTRGGDKVAKSAKAEAGAKKAGQAH